MKKALYKNSDNTNKVISSTRYLMAFAVLAIFIGSSVLLLAGTLGMLSGIWEVITDPGESWQELRVVLIESVDTILISTVLYVIAVGLYQLFIDNNLDVPKWLRTRDVSDLEQRLSGMVVTILGVIFMTQAIGEITGIELLWFGLAVAAVICALSAFMYQEKIGKKK